MESIASFSFSTYVWDCLFHIWKKEGLPEISGRPISPIHLATGRTTSAKERYGALWSFRRAESTCRYVLDASYGRYIITMRRNVNYFFACPKKNTPRLSGRANYGDFISTTWATYDIFSRCASPFRSSLLRLTSQSPL